MAKKYEEIGDSEIARLFYGFSHAAIGGVGRVVFGFRVEGAENIPSAGPAFLLLNHISGADVVFGPDAVPGRHTTVIGREGIMTTPVLGDLFKAWGARVIHRVATDEINREAYEESVRVMKEPAEEGRLVTIFGSPPTRTPGKKPAKPIGTIARLARETGAPVVPGVIKGSDRLLRNYGVVVKFGGPMYHRKGKSYDKEFKNRIHIAQHWLFDSIDYPFEYDEPDEKIVLKPDKRK